MAFIDYPTTNPLGKVSETDPTGEAGKVCNDNFKNIFDRVAGPRIIAMGSSTLAGGMPYRKFIAVPDITANCMIFLTCEGDQPPGRLNVVSRTLSGTKGFTVEGESTFSFNWLVIAP